MTETICYYVPRGRGDPEAPASRTPAGRIVKLLGGPAATALYAQARVKTVYRWLAARAGGGTGGRIPHAAQVRIIANATAQGLVLAHADFAPKAGEAFT